jgi:hypothetical protein
VSLSTEWVSDYCLMPNEPLFSYIMWEQVTICQLYHVTCENKLQFVSCIMWDQVTIFQLYHVRTSYNLSAISCENKLQFVSCIMREQVTICQLYHVRTSYNLSAISCENKLQFVSYIMWEQVTICQLYHVRTSYNLSTISCENKIQFVSYIMWEQVTIWWDDDVCIVLDCNQIFINHMESLFLFIVTKIRRGTVRQGRFGQNVVQWWRLSRLDSIDIHFLMI